MKSFACGHTAGACVNGGRNYYYGNPVGMFGCDPVPDSLNEVWAVDLQGATIELPGSGMELPYYYNLSSGHAIVCLG